MALKRGSRRGPPEYYPTRLLAEGQRIIAVEEEATTFRPPPPHEDRYPERAQLVRFCLWVHVEAVARFALNPITAWGLLSMAAAKSGWFGLTAPSSSVSKLVAALASFARPRHARHQAGGRRLQPQPAG